MYEELGAAYLGQIVAKQVMHEAFYGKSKNGQPTRGKTTVKKASLFGRMKQKWYRLRCA